jgi:streptomycin 6-kinase
MGDAAFPITEKLRRKVTGVYGAAGSAWLERIPAVVRECADLWGLTVGAPFADGGPVVLKVGVPEPQQAREAEALRLYDGEGAARLIAWDAERGALLIERLAPGTPLSELTEDDEVSVPAAADVMRRLWRPVPDGHRFPTVADWAQDIPKYLAAFPTGGPYPRRLIDEAAALFDELLPTSDAPVLLHGDLHHDNILRAGRSPWLAIDPKGLVGEPAYEVGALLRNPGPQIASEPDLRRLLRRRIGLFARALDMDAERLRKWGMAQAVLSACWTWEDNDEPPVLAFRVAAALSEA